GGAGAGAEPTRCSHPPPRVTTDASTINTATGFEMKRFLRTFRCSEKCLVQIPLAVNRAPSLAMMHKSRSPLLSMNLTSSRSTMHARPSSVRWFTFQHVPSSCTQGPARRPCRIHLSSVGVLLKLIFNMLFSPHLVIRIGEHSRTDKEVISFSNPHRCSWRTFPGARVPPASSRPGRIREFRHVRCESQRLADGFLYGTARCCLFLLERPAEHLVASSEHQWLDFVTSWCLLPFKGFRLTSTSPSVYESRPGGRLESKMNPAE